jgi:hypothetical protein
MPQIDISKPVRLGRAFWSLYAVLLGPSIWFLRPSNSNLPLSSVVIGASLVPFLASVALYCIGLFVFALVTDFTRQRKAFALAFMCLVAPVVSMGAVIYFPGLSRRITGMGALLAILACLLANGLILFLFRNKPGRPGPASDLVNPAQDGESRPQ